MGRKGHGNPTQRESTLLMEPGHLSVHFPSRHLGWLDSFRHPIWGRVSPWHAHLYYVSSTGSVLLDKEVIKRTAVCPSPSHLTAKPHIPGSGRTARHWLRKVAGNLLGPLRKPSNMNHELLSQGTRTPLSSPQWRNQQSPQLPQHASLLLHNPAIRACSASCSPGDPEPLGSCQGFLMYRLLLIPCY